jgi:hypothetical protein
MRATGRQPARVGVTGRQHRPRGRSRPANRQAVRAAIATAAGALGADAAQSPAWRPSPAQSATAQPSGIAIPRFAGIAVVLAVSLIALLPAWRTAWYQDDQLPSVFRTLHTDLAHHQGVLFPRMAFELGFGYGQLLHQVYPPLGFELTAWFHAVGLGYIDAVRLFFSICLVGGSLGMYGYGRTVLYGQLSPTLAALVYVLAPYTLLDAHPGGDFGESLAIALLPWAAWSVHLLVVRRTWARFAGAVLALTAVNLAHNITALFLTGLLCLYVLALTARLGHQYGRRAASNSLITAAGAMALALALSAFYWAPALLEMGYTRIGEQRQGSFNVEEYLLPPGRLLQSTLVYSYEHVDQHRFGLLHGLVTGSAGIVIGIAAARRPRHRAVPRLDLLVVCGCMILFLGVLLLQLRASEVIWDTVPLIQFAQFPRRLYLFATLASAVIIGALPWALSALQVDGKGLSLPWRLGVAASLVCLLAVSSLPGVYWPLPVSRSHELSEEQVAIGSSADTRFSQRSAYDDFLPAWVTEKQAEIPRRPRRSDPYQHANELPAPHIEVLEWGYQQIRLAAQADAPSAVVLHRFYFPGWRATANGVELPVRPIGPLGLTGTELPPGQHDVTFTFGDTPLRTGATAVSAGAALTLLVALVRGFGGRRTLVVGVMVALAVALPWYRHVRSAPAPETVVSPLALPMSPAARLVGMSRPEQRYHHGETIRVKVFWQATDWSTVDRRSGLRLVDPRNGAVVAERWQHPNLGRTPTSKWVRGLLVPDELRLRVPEGVQPGRYQVLAGLRDNAAAALHSVGEVVVEPPR